MEFRNDRFGDIECRLYCSFGILLSILLLFYCNALLCYFYSHYLFNISEDEESDELFFQAMLANIQAIAEMKDEGEYEDKDEDTDVLLESEG